MSFVRIPSSVNPAALMGKSEDLEYTEVADDICILEVCYFIPPE